MSFIISEDGCLEAFYKHSSSAGLVKLCTAGYDVLGSKEVHRIIYNFYSFFRQTPDLKNVKHERCPFRKKETETLAS